MSDNQDEFDSLPGLGKEFELPVLGLKLALLRQKVERMERDLGDLESDIEEGYATKAELTALAERVKMPIRIVYSMAAVILTSFLAAVVSLVMKAH